jgi:hypothetical protein
MFVDFGVKIEGKSPIVAKYDLPGVCWGYPQEYRPKSKSLAGTVWKECITLADHNHHYNYMELVLFRHEEVRNLIVTVCPYE